ncbi:hypothetical protein [Photobacterium sp. Hal280]|uniref:hypothetical protein n=1 Tax=Photobacterium sp. Hal280 TaxID=3035163 RepID=UPI00301C266A
MVTNEDAGNGETILQSSIEVTAAYTYDPLGRRISKTVNGEQTQFDWLGNTLLRESGPQGQKDYTYRCQFECDDLSYVADTGTLEAVYVFGIFPANSDPPFPEMLVNSGYDSPGHHLAGLRKYD